VDLDHGCPLINFGSSKQHRKERDKDAVGTNATGEEVRGEEEVFECDGGKINWMKMQFLRVPLTLPMELVIISSRLLHRLILRRRPMSCIIFYRNRNGVHEIEIKSRRLVGHVLQIRLLWRKIMMVHRCYRMISVWIRNFNVR